MFWIKIFNLDIGFKVIIYFLFVDIFFIEYKFDWVMWYWIYSLNKWCWIDGLRKKRIDFNMVGINYFFLVGWCFVKISMIYSFVLEIFIIFSYSNMIIFYFVVCFLYKFVLEVSVFFFKYCFSNCWWFGIKIGICMYWVYYYINLYYKILVWR